MSIYIDLLFLCCWCGVVRCWSAERVYIHWFVVSLQTKASWINTWVSRCPAETSCIVWSLWKRMPSHPRPQRHHSCQWYICHARPDLHLFIRPSCELCVPLMLKVIPQQGGWFLLITIRIRSLQKGRGSFIIFFFTEIPVYIRFLTYFRDFFYYVAVAFGS